MSIMMTIECINMILPFFNLMYLPALVCPFLNNLCMLGVQIHGCCVTRIVQGIQKYRQNSIPLWRHAMGCNAVRWRTT